MTSSILPETEERKMTKPNELTESESNVTRLAIAFALLPKNLLKLSKPEREALETAQTKLNSQDW